MKSALILCDGAVGPSSGATDRVLKLCTSGTKQNLRVDTYGLEDGLLHCFSPLLRDLVRIAAFVYGADTRISRGTKCDVFAEDWPRLLKFVLPVEKVDVWSDPKIIDGLRETLEFLTGDRFEFQFVQAPPPPGRQQFIDWHTFGPLMGTDVVMMFSGGADSLAATLKLLRDKRHPLLVSHRPTPPIDARQKNLVKLLCERYGQGRLSQASIVVNRRDTGGRSQFEPTQRSRSFLFTSLGVACATSLGVNDVRLCDNGVVSINLPRLDQSYGSMLSRSTHPKYIRLAQGLFRAVTGASDLIIQNDLLASTKKEVFEIIAASGHPDLIQETVSCAHVEGKTGQQPHCGVCSQCIDRRFATTAASLEEHDLASRYEVDIFSQPIEKPIDRLQVESYLRFAQKLEGINSASNLLEIFPELFDCLGEGDAQVESERIFGVFQRHQKAVNAVLESQMRLKLPDIRRGRLSENCLIRMVCLATHMNDPRFKYVERLKSLLCGSFRQAFQTEPAKNERHLQDFAQALLASAQESLAREVPMLPFATVSTKPDFADMPVGAVKPPLFVEFKYLKGRQRLNSVVTEITSRMTIYRKQGAYVLFVVYDPKIVITDDSRFIHDHEDAESIWLGIAR